MGDALHTDGGVTSAQEARIADAGLLALDGPGAFDVRTGVFFGPGSTSLVSGTTTTAPSWTYQIATCNWVTSRGAANGPYRGALEQATTVSTALPPASNSRIDVIWVKQGDAAAGVPSPDGTTEPVYGVTSGAAAPSPTKPAIPVGAVEIATAVVPSSATGGTGGSGVVITQTARQTVARGAAIPVRSQAERDALTAFDGLAVKRLDLGGVQEDRVSGGWVRQGGVVPIPRQPLSLPGDWEAYGSNLATPMGALLPTGLVVLEGMARAITGQGSTASRVIFPIPAPFRATSPRGTLTFSIAAKLGSYVANVRLDVDPYTGVMTVMRHDQTNFFWSPNDAWISLAGVQYTV